jgi:hypothetical protein
LDKVRGSISEGRQADLVLLDANPFEAISNTKQIRAVVVAGEHLDSARLDEIKQRAIASKDTEPDYPTILSRTTARFDSKPNLADALLLGAYQFAKGDYGQALTYYRYAEEQGAGTVKLLDRFFLNLKLNLLFEKDSPLQCRDAWDDADAVLEGLQHDPELSLDILERILEVAKFRKCEDTKNRYVEKREHVQISPTGSSTP